MNRKTFIKKMAGAVLISIPAYAVLGCSSSDDGTLPPASINADCLVNGTQSSMDANHGYTPVVSITDLQNGTDKQYSMQRGSVHIHSVTISCA